MTSPRLRCERCARPASQCLCAHVQVVSHRTEVLVLQHPDEQAHPLNTARLAVLGLARAQCWVGERFPELPARLAQARCPVLLFPGPQALSPRELGGESSAGAVPDLLVVPDGTWRQAGRLVRQNPVLEGLARVVLAGGLPSRYRLRRASRPDAVSTLEAIVRTLAELEPDVDFQPALRPFEAMIEGQIRAMGESAYARHVALGRLRTNR